MPRNSAVNLPHDPGGFLKGCVEVENDGTPPKRAAPSLRIERETTMRGRKIAALAVEERSAARSRPTRVGLCEA